jgi:hypothetical protein
MYYFGRERKIRTWDMFQCYSLDGNVKSEHRTCSNGSNFTFPTKVVHWNMSSGLILRSRPTYYTGTCFSVLILRSRPRYCIGTCPMFWFYVPVQTITLEHVFCSDFMLPSKLCKIRTYDMFQFNSPDKNVKSEHRTYCNKSDFLFVYEIKVLHGFS